ncbi:MAG: PEP-CTERM sorting domain-containing protein [Phycisphaeraceae bacterium]
MTRKATLLACSLILTGSAFAAPTTTSSFDVSAFAFDGLLLNDDLVAGKLATELPEDTGWHPANAASLFGSTWSSGLPAFTDGTNGLGSDSTYGLLNDFPGAGVPTKVIQFDLDEPSNVTGINILTGNNNNADGRIFSTTVIRYSTDNGSNFDLLGYFESAPLGSLNNESGDPGTTTFKSLFLEIFDDGGGNLASGVTNLQFDFYAVDNTGGQYRDPFDGENPFTNVDDGFSAGFVSPLLLEIDVIGGPGVAVPNDLNGDGLVNADDIDYLTAGFGGSDPVRDTDGSGTVDQDDVVEYVTVDLGSFMGDSNLDSTVDLIDLSALASNFGGNAGWAGGDFSSDGLVDLVDLSTLASNFGSSNPVPEPTSLTLLGLAALAINRRF